MKVLLGITGSVAATLAPKLLIKLRDEGHDLSVISTKSSEYFWACNHYNTNVYSDNDEWPDKQYTKNQPILHIELRKWADVLLIAPLSANTLAKIANGFADNLITSVARAWDPNKRIILAPAMNTFMWEHPVTVKHLLQIQEWFPKTTIIQPIEKTLACGDTGIGAMALIPDIVSAIKE